MFCRFRRLLGAELIGCEWVLATTSSAPMSWAGRIGLDVEGMKRRIEIRAIDLGAPTASAELPALCDRLRSVSEASPGMVVTCDVAGLSSPDCATVEGLARLQLTARRLGCTVRLRNASDELHGLLALSGLCGVVGLCGPSDP